MYIPYLYVHSSIWSEMFNCFSRQKEALLDRCHVAVSSCCYVAMSQADCHIANPRSSWCFQSFNRIWWLTTTRSSGGWKVGVDLQLRRPPWMQDARPLADQQWTDTQQIQPDCCKYLHSNRRIGCCKLPLSRLIKSNVFDCSRRNFNACAWKLDTAIVQLGSIMCNQERTKGPPKDYVAVVIPGPLLFSFVLVFRCLVISCHILFCVLSLQAMESGFHCAQLSQCHMNSYDSNMIVILYNIVYHIVHCLASHWHFSRTGDFQGSVGGVQQWKHCEAFLSFDNV